MEDSQTKQGILKNHICWAQDKDICEQCVRPWHDGICECGHFNDENIQRIFDIARELIKNGHDLNKL
jgi:hypothetical protein